MRVLVITGDKSFSLGHPRFDLQFTHVEKLVSVYWGKGALWPHFPREKCDIVTSQDPFWRGLFALLVARRLRTKLNIQVHADLSAQNFVRRLCARFVLKHAHTVRVVSKKIEKQVLNMGVRVPIYILPIYIDVESFRLLKKVTHARKTILWIGRFEVEKNPEDVVTILTEVRSRGIDAKLVMLGSGSLETGLQKKARNLPIEFPGWEDPKNYLSVTDVVLCTSLHESFGASIVESLAADIPVVAPDVGIAKEAGAIVVPREKLAEAVIDVLKSDSKIKGKLQLELIKDPKEWAEAWKETL